MTITVNTDTTPAAAVAWIALGKLGVALENVRRTDRRGDVEGLAESIATEGLLQNLTGFQTETGRYRIVAGGRRLTALKALARSGRWSGPVPVRVLASASDAQRVSLTENVMRRALHPADEFEAFAGLIAEGYDAGEVARRFGTSVRHVEQRMKLAAVSPILVKAYRAGALSLDQLTAFAVVDDPARQLAVWSGKGRVCDLSPRAIRSALLSEHVPVTDKRARFVGLEAYEAAGGGVLRDLFGDDETGVWLSDLQLLNRLAAEKMEVEAEAIRGEGWAWVQTFDALPYGGFHVYGRVYPRPLPRSDAQEAELARLRAERDALEAQAKREPTSVVLEALERIDAAIADQQTPDYAYGPQDRQRAGCVIGLDAEGKVRVERGLIRPEDVKREAKAARAAAAAEERTQGVDGASPALSEALIEELTAQRTAALRVEVMRRPELALIGVVHALALPAFYPHAYEVGSCFDVRANDVRPGLRVADAEGCGALQVIAAAQEAWSQRLPNEPETLWGWLTEQPHDEVLALFAFLASASLDAVQRRHEGRSARVAHVDAVARTAGLDMAAWWSADEAFLSRMSKAQLAAAVTDAVSPFEGAALAKLPKAEAVRRAAKTLADAHWLPSALRRSALSNEAGSADDAAGEAEAALAA